MPKRELRRYLIVYHALGPLVWIGLTFLALLWLLSIFLPGDRAEKARVLGVLQFGVLVLIGLIRAIAVIWRTRKHE